MIEIIVIPDGSDSSLTLKETIAEIDDFEVLEEDTLWTGGAHVPKACIKELENNSELFLVLLDLPTWTRYFSHISADLLERIIPVFVGTDHYPEPFLSQEVSNDLDLIAERIREVHTLITGN